MPLSVLSLRALRPTSLFNLSKEMGLYIQGNSKIINAVSIKPDKPFFSY